MPSKRAKEFQKQFKQDQQHDHSHDSGLVTESDEEGHNKKVGETGPSFGVKEHSRPLQSKAANRPSVKKELSSKLVSVASVPDAAHEGAEGLEKQLEMLRSSSRQRNSSQINAKSKTDCSMVEAQESAQLQSVQDKQEHMITDTQKESQQPLSSSAFAQVSAPAAAQVQRMQESEGFSDKSFYRNASSTVKEHDAEQAAIETRKSQDTSSNLGVIAHQQVVSSEGTTVDLQRVPQVESNAEEDDQNNYALTGSSSAIKSVGVRNQQDFQTDSKPSRTKLKHRFQTARTGHARNQKANPYVSDRFTEKDFLMASNAYHRLDKSQNFMSNKAFAQTIISDLKQRQRQTEFEKRLGLAQESEYQDTSSKMYREPSKEHFKKQQSEIYNSTKSSKNARTVTQHTSHEEIQNLKEVLSSSTQFKPRGGTAYTTSKNQRKSPSLAKEMDINNYELPEDAAQRWMTNAQMQASQTFLRKHGGDYLDTKPKLLPQARSISQKHIETPGGMNVGLSRIESAHDDDGVEEAQKEKSLLDSSIKYQEKELKRIMQSQKSLANATKSIVKLMKVHDQASNFSLVDVNQTALNRGSASYLNTRLMTNDPSVFSRPETSSQFRVKKGKGSVQSNQDLLGKGYMSITKKESHYLNQQRQLHYLKSQAAGVGGGSKNVQGVMRAATAQASDIRTKPRPQAMNTNLNAVIQTNPEQFIPAKPASINFTSTDYNFISFVPGSTKLQQPSHGAFISRMAQAGNYGTQSKSVALTRKNSGVVGRQANAQSTVFADALIQHGKTSNAFYKGYSVSKHVQHGCPMAPNYHPEYARVINENKRAFFRKSGMGASHLDHATTAVARKSNQLLEASRMTPAAGSSKPNSRGGVNSSLRTNPQHITANSGQRLF